MYYIGVTEGKIEKEGKMSFSNFIFIYTIHLAYLKMFTKFKNTGSNRSGEKELEDLKVLRRSPDLLNNVKIGQGQLQL